LGLQLPKWEFTWECGGSFLHILPHSREDEMWLSALPTWPTPLQALAFVANLRLGLWHYMSIHVVYTWKSCAWLPCLNYTNPWNKMFCMDLEWAHEAYKFFLNMCFYLTSEMCSIIINLTCDKLLMKFVWSLFIHRFIHFTHKYHVLKRCSTHKPMLWWMKYKPINEWMPHKFCIFK
jgi:hypothetical protein